MTRVASQLAGNTGFIAPGYGAVADVVNGVQCRKIGHSPAPGTRATADLGDRVDRSPQYLGPLLPPSPPCHGGALMPPGGASPTAVARPDAMLRAWVRVLRSSALGVAGGAVPSQRALVLQAVSALGPAAVDAALLGARDLRRLRVRVASDIEQAIRVLRAEGAAPGLVAVERMGVRSLAREMARALSDAFFQREALEPVRAALVDALTPPVQLMHGLTARPELRASLRRLLEALPAREAEGYLEVLGLGGGPLSDALGQDADAEITARAQRAHDRVYALRERVRNTMAGRSNGHLEIFDLAPHLTAEVLARGPHRDNLRWAWDGRAPRNAADEALGRGFDLWRRDEEEWWVNGMAVVAGIASLPVVGVLGAAGRLASGAAATAITAATSLPGLALGAARARDVALLEQAGLRTRGEAEQMLAACLLKYVLTLTLRSRLKGLPQAIQALVDAGLACAGAQAVDEAQERLRR